VEGEEVVKYLLLAVLLLVAGCERQDRPSMEMLKRYECSFVQYERVKFETQMCYQGTSLNYHMCYTAALVRHCSNNMQVAQ